MVKTRNWLFAVVFMIIVFFLSGCSFSNLKKDLQEMEAMTTIKGTIETELFTATGPIIVGLLKDDPHHPTLVNYRILKKPGEFNFTVPVDDYLLFAYEDANNDQKYQPSEYISEFIIVDKLVSGTKITVPVTIRGETQLRLQLKVEELRSRGKQGKEFKYVTPGTLVQLDSPAFAIENIEKGLWQPLQFIRSVPFGLFFLEDYAQDKIPVLYVHGVSGSPKEFKTLIDNLDRSKYQPWVWYYPSGFSISLVGEALSRVIEETQVLYGFKDLVVIAHSMGGLVTRSFINLHSQSEKLLSMSKYITISTPWGGHDAASMGLKYAPTVIPVWSDIVPGSQFLNTIFDTPLPEMTKHFLLFGYRGDSMFAGGNSDGVVSIASELHMDAQQGAELVRGYDEDHTSILSSQEVIDFVNTVLME